MASPTPNAASAGLTLLQPRFWSVLFRTWLMKRQYDKMDDKRYTEHLHRFYTRRITPSVEYYGDKYEIIRQPVVDAAKIQPGDRTLDIATGGGYQAAAFAHNGANATGMDIVVDRARLASEVHGWDHITWGTADASRLPFADNSFDVVSISLALHDMPEDIQRRALREFKRVARRRVVIIEPRAPERRGLYRWLYINVGDLFDESLHFGDYVQRDFKSHLIEAGLDLVEMKRVFYGLLAIYVCDVD